MTSLLTTIIYLCIYFTAVCYNKQNSLCTAADPLWSYLCCLSFSLLPLLFSGQSQHRSHQKVQLLCLRFKKRLSESSLFLVSLFICSYCSSFPFKTDGGYYFVIHDGKSLSVSLYIILYILISNVKIDYCS